MSTHLNRLTRQRSKRMVVNHTTTDKVLEREAPYKPPATTQRSVELGKLNGRYRTNLVLNRGRRTILSLVIVRILVGLRNAYRLSSKEPAITLLRPFEEYQ